MVLESDEFKSSIDENNQIRVERIISATEKEVFSFYFVNSFETVMTLFLDKYYLMQRSSPRHKFRVSKKYSRLDDQWHRQANPESISLSVVPLTDKIKNLALEKFRSEVKIGIWKR